MYLFDQTAISYSLFGCAARPVKNSRYISKVITFSNLFLRGSFRLFLRQAQDRRHLVAFFLTLIDNLLFDFIHNRFTNPDISCATTTN